MCEIYTVMPQLVKLTTVIVTPSSFATQFSQVGWGILVTVGVNFISLFASTSGVTASQLFNGMLAGQDSDRTMSNSKSGYCDGKLKDGALNGFHVCTFPSGNRYQGELQNSQRQGKGIFVYADGTRCEGEFRNDLLNGQGNCTFASGNRYAGEFHDNQRQGRGVFTYRDGTRCEGEFRNDFLTGFGACAFASGNRYEGQFQGNQRYGRGVFAYRDGTRCEGEFQDELMNGFGVCTFSNGDRFEGEFRQSKRHGRGTYVFANNTRIEGTWRDGRFETQTSRVVFKKQSISNQRR